MSLKLWLILFVIREITKFVEEKKDVSPREAALLYAKWLLTWESGDTVRFVLADNRAIIIFRKHLETLLNGAVNSFPYRHSLLFETMMKVDFYFF